MAIIKINKIYHNHISTTDFCLFFRVIREIIENSLLLTQCTKTMGKSYLYQAQIPYGIQNKTMYLNWNNYVVDLPVVDRGWLKAAAAAAWTAPRLRYSELVSRL